MLSPQPIRYEGDAATGVLQIIDQRRLPNEVWYVTVRSLDDACGYIKSLAVRGAPALGVFGAYAFFVAVRNCASNMAPRLWEQQVQWIYKELRATRPTAVDLGWALAQQLWMCTLNADAATLLPALLDNARAIQAATEDATRKLGNYGNDLIEDGDAILTHCNAGILAAPGIGTALAPIYHAATVGKKITVYADETRPLLQGARLTAWELSVRQIPVTVLCDGAAGSLLAAGKIQRIFVGADRIARNGDFANKIGTYSLAVLAKYHHVPFYVVAPDSTFDLDTPTGKDIQIEQRAASELRYSNGHAVVPERANVYNPAFDVTPAALVSAYVTTTGRYSHMDIYMHMDALQKQEA